MTAIELNHALQMEVASLADHEGLSLKVLNYIKRVKSQYEQQFISKQEVMAGIEAGLKDVKEGKGISLDEFMQEMNNEVYA